MLSLTSWCTCKIAVLFLRMKRLIDRSVGLTFVAHPVYTVLTMFYVDATTVAYLDVKEP